jgi:hypothetical protein
MKPEGGRRVRDNMGKLVSGWTSQSRVMTASAIFMGVSSPMIRRIDPDG